MAATLEALQQHMDDVLRRLARLEAESGILRTLHRYGHAIDSGEEAMWVDCFTENGRFSTENPDPARPNADVRGRQALAEFAARHPRRPRMHLQHGVLEPRIDIAAQGDSAACTSYFVILMRWIGIAPIMRSFGRYSDEFVREPDGIWRLRWRHAVLDASTPGLPNLATRPPSG